MNLKTSFLNIFAFYLLVLVSQHDAKKTINDIDPLYHHIISERTVSYFHFPFMYLRNICYNIEIIK